MLSSQETKVYVNTKKPQLKICFEKNKNHSLD